MNSNVLAKQISSLVNSLLEDEKNLKKKKKKKKKIFFFFFFLKILGAKADPRYKRTRVITRRVLTGLTCISCFENSVVPGPLFSIRNWFCQNLAVCSDDFIFSSTMVNILILIFCV